MDYPGRIPQQARTPPRRCVPVKDGDWVDYTSGLGFPPLLDAALAAPA